MSGDTGDREWIFTKQVDGELKLQEQTMLGTLGLASVEPCPCTEPQSGDTAHLPLLEFSSVLSKR